MHPLLAAPDINFSLVVFLVVSFISWLISLAKKNEKAAAARPPRPAAEVRPRPSRERQRPALRPADVATQQETDRRTSAQAFEESKRANRERRENDRDRRPQVRSDPELKQLVMNHLQNVIESRQEGSESFAESLDHRSLLAQRKSTQKLETPGRGQDGAAATHVTAATIAAAMRNPQEVRKAIVLNEILTRPDFSRRRR